jgi:hypothetical protein
MRPIASLKKASRWLARSAKASADQHRHPESLQGGEELVQQPRFTLPAEHLATTSAA